MDYFSRSALRIAANLVVSSWAYLLSIHSCLLDSLLAEFLESWIVMIDSYDKFFNKWLFFS